MIDLLLRTLPYLVYPVVNIAPPGTYVLDQNTRISFLVFFWQDNS